MFLYNEQVGHELKDLADTKKIFSVGDLVVYKTTQNNLVFQDFVEQKTYIKNFEFEFDFIVDFISLPEKILIGLQIISRHDNKIKIINSIYEYANKTFKVCVEEITEQEIPYTSEIFGCFFAKPICWSLDSSFVFGNLSTIKTPFLSNTLGVYPSTYDLEKFNFDKKEFFQHFLNLKIYSIDDFEEEDFTISLDNFLGTSWFDQERNTFFNFENKLTQFEFFKIEDEMFFGYQITTKNEFITNDLQTENFGDKTFFCCFVLGTENKKLVFKFTPNVFDEVSGVKTTPQSFFKDLFSVQKETFQCWKKDNVYHFLYFDRTLKENTFIFNEQSFYEVEHKSFYRNLDFELVNNIDFSFVTGGGTKEKHLNFDLQVPTFLTEQSNTFGFSFNPSLKLHGEKTFPKLTFLNCQEVSFVDFFVHGEQQSLMFELVLNQQEQLKGTSSNLQNDHCQFSLDLFACQNGVFELTYRLQSTERSQIKKLGLGRILVTSTNFIGLTQNRGLLKVRTLKTIAPVEDFNHTCRIQNFNHERIKQDLVFYFSNTLEKFFTYEFSELQNEIISYQDQHALLITTFSNFKCNVIKMFYEQKTERYLIFYQIKNNYFFTELKDFDHEFFSRSSFCVPSKIDVNETSIDLIFDENINYPVPFCEYIVTNVLADFGITEKFEVLQNNLFEKSSLKQRNIFSFRNFRNKITLYSFDRADFFRAGNDYYFDVTFFNTVGKVKTSTYHFLFPLLPVEDLEVTGVSSFSSPEFSFNVPIQNYNAWFALFVFDSAKNKLTDLGFLFQGEIKSILEDLDRKTLQVKKCNFRLLGLLPETEYTLLVVPISYMTDLKLDLKNESYEYIKNSSVYTELNFKTQQLPFTQILSRATFGATVEYQMDFYSVDEFLELQYLFVQKERKWNGTEFVSALPNEQVNLSEQPFDAPNRWTPVQGDNKIVIHNVLENAELFLFFNFFDRYRLDRMLFNHEREGDLLMPSNFTFGDVMSDTQVWQKNNLINRFVLETKFDYADLIEPAVSLEKGFDYVLLTVPNLKTNQTITLKTGEQKTVFFDTNLVHAYRLHLLEQTNTTSIPEKFTPTFVGYTVQTFNKQHLEKTHLRVSGLKTGTNYSFFIEPVFKGAINSDEYNQMLWHTLKNNKESFKTLNCKLIPNTLLKIKEVNATTIQVELPTVEQLFVLYEKKISSSLLRSLGLALRLVDSEQETIFSSDFFGKNVLLQNLTPETTYQFVGYNHSLLNTAREFDAFETQFLNEATTKINDLAPSLPENFIGNLETLTPLTYTSEKKLFASFDLADPVFSLPEKHKPAFLWVTTLETVTTNNDIKYWEKFTLQDFNFIVSNLPLQKGTNTFCYKTSDTLVERFSETKTFDVVVADKYEAFLPDVFSNGFYGVGIDGNDSRTSESSRIVKLGQNFDISRIYYKITDNKTGLQVSDDQKTLITYKPKIDSFYLTIDYFGERLKDGFYSVEIFFYSVDGTKKQFVKEITLTISVGTLPTPKIKLETIPII